MAAHELSLNERLTLAARILYEAAVRIELADAAAAEEVAA